METTIQDVARKWAVRDREIRVIVWRRSLPPKSRNYGIQESLRKAMPSACTHLSLEALVLLSFLVDAVRAEGTAELQAALNRGDDDAAVAFFVVASCWMEFRHFRLAVVVAAVALVRDSVF